jgi:tape measure domain-containing protein
MPTRSLGDMVVRIIGDNTEFDTSIDKSESKFTKFEKTAAAMGGKLSLFVTTPLVLLGKKFIDSTGQMQMFQASFETMLGSVEKAQGLMADLQTFAAKTPFEFTGLANSTKTLLQFGVSANKVMPTLKQLGDIAQGDQNKLNSLALVFGQMSSAGRLMGQDLLQMINAGFNPLREIADATGESYVSLKQKMEKGLITTDMVTESFKRATSEGGKFFGGMEKASKTLPGLLATLNDDFMTMGRSLVTSFIPPLTTIVKHLSGFFQWVTDLSAVNQRWIAGIAVVAAGMGPAVLGISGMVKAVGALKVAMQALTVSGGPIMLTIGAVAALAAGLVYLAQKTAENKKKQEEFWNVANQNEEQLAKTIETATKKRDTYNKQIAATNVQLEETKQTIEDTAVAMLKQGYTEETVANFRKNAYAGIADQTASASAEAEKYNDHIQKAEARLKALADAKKADAKATAAQEEASRKAAEATAKYEAALSNVKNILEGQKSEQQKLYEQLQVLESFRGKTENDEIQRQQAIEILLDKQIALIEQDAKEYREAIEEKKVAAKEKNDAILAAEKKAYAEMADLYKSDTQRKIDSIDAQAAAWIQAGVDEVAATKWAEDAKAAIASDAADFEKALAIDTAISTVGIATDAIKAVSDAMMVSIEDGWADLSSSVVETIGKISGDPIIQASANTLSAVIQIVDDWINYEKKVAQSQFETISDVNMRIRDYKIQMVNDELEAVLRSLDEQEKAALKAAGFIEQTDKEKLEEKLATETDANKKLEIQKAIDKQKILDEYDKKRAEAEAKAVKETKRLERERAEFEKALTLAQIKIERKKAISELGWGHKDEKAELNALYDELESTVASMPLPSLATGAIALPKKGGTDVTVAEAGTPEAIIPLDRLGDVLSSMTQPAIPSMSGDGTPIHLQVLMDSKPFLDKIFPATKNKTILIHANAVVR